MNLVALSEQFRFGLAEVVFEWAKGTPFGDICNLTDVQEGVIVRCIQRLDETCRFDGVTAALLRLSICSEVSLFLRIRVFQPL